MKQIQFNISKIFISLILFQEINHQHTDSFGRQIQSNSSLPGSITSDRVGNSPDAVNNAILTKGWLRVKSADTVHINPEEPNVEFTKEIKQNEGINESQEPINYNENYQEKLSTNKGFAVNPLFKEGTFTPVPCLSCFYFRLSGLSLQFTQIKEDMTVIGQVAIKNIRKLVEIPGRPCLSIISTYSNWELCAASQAEGQEWQCSIMQAMRSPCTGAASNEPPSSPMNALVGKQNIVMPEWIMPIPSPWCNENWDQDSRGTNWECRCWDGMHQSPIDLPPVQQLEEITSGADIEFFKVDSEMIVDKNFITLIPKDKDKGFGLMTSYVGDVQRATQVIFHLESDHTQNGHHFPMEAQIMQKSDDAKKAGKKAMISVLFHMETGVKNPLMEEFVWDVLTGHGVQEGNHALDLSQLFIDSNENKNKLCLPISLVKFDQWLQGGSVPFPPCDENTWVIVRKGTIGIANQYFEMFKKARELQWSSGQTFKNKKNKMGNSRMVKPLNNRKVYFVKNGDCDSGEVPFDGHWEVLKHTQNDYIQVDSKSPSGLPGAFTISNKEVGI